MSHFACYYHIIWRTCCSEFTITEANEKELYAYILGLCKAKGCVIYRIGGIENHIHMLISIRPDIAVSTLMRVLKTGTSKWLKANNNKFPLFKGWATGFAVFTYCQRERDMIYQYIKNQKQHHKGQTLSDEYVQILRTWNIDPSTDKFLQD